MLFGIDKGRRGKGGGGEREGGRAADKGNLHGTEKSEWGNIARLSPSCRSLIARLKKNACLGSTDL